MNTQGYVRDRRLFGIAASVFCSIVLFIVTPSLADDLKKAQELYDQATLRNKQGDLAGAIDDLTSALRENPRFADAFNLRSGLYFVQKNYQASLADSTAAIAINSTKPVYFAYRCDTYRAMGNLDAALSDCNRAIDLDPRYASAYSYRAAVRKAKGDASGAEADLAKSRQLKAPSSPPPANQPTPSSATVAPKSLSTEYGSESELKGLTRYYVVIGGDEVAIRNAIIEFIGRKHPGLQIVERRDLTPDTIVLHFYGLNQGNHGTNVGEVLRYTSSQKRVIASFRPSPRRDPADSAREFAKDFLNLYEKVNAP
jgi:tetratricopeptide (TPR) repeat protein